MSFKILKSTGLGFLDFESKFTEQNCQQELDTNTLFEAASATKTVVTVAILHLVEKGVLDLDTDVNTYFKDWKIPENKFTKHEKVTLRSPINPYSWSKSSR